MNAKAHVKRLLRRRVASRGQQKTNYWLTFILFHQYSALKQTIFLLMVFCFCFSIPA